MEHSPLPRGKNPPVINVQTKTRAIITVYATTNVYEGLRKISKEERNATKRILASYTRIYGTHVNPTLIEKIRRSSFI